MHLCFIRCYDIQSEVTFTLRLLLAYCNVPLVTVIIADTLLEQFQKEYRRVRCPSLGANNISNPTDVIVEISALMAAVVRNFKVFKLTLL